jgi:murein DD-endopeptidase MepM/ murein hydrolase activator NlpD
VKAARLRTLLLLALLSSAGALAGDPCVKVTEKKLANGLDLIAELGTCSEVIITVRFDLGENLRSTLPETTESRGRTRFLVGSLRQLERAPWRYEGWHYDWKVGRRLKEVPPPATYRLPFEGKRKVIQGPFGSFSHYEGSQDEEAIDWAMPEGTRVLAARGGVVVALRDDVTEGGPDISYKPNCNYVALMHDDGTFSQYVHLQRGGVLVKVGDRVSAGDVLGLSGNTGWTTQPHLHFEVFHALDGKNQVTLPITFEEPLGDAPARRAPPKKQPRDDDVQRAVDDFEEALDD